MAAPEKHSLHQLRHFGALLSSSAMTLFLDFLQAGPRPFTNPASANWRVARKARKIRRRWLYFIFFGFSISLVICSRSTTCRCVTTGMALYLSNQVESMWGVIYNSVAVRLLCIHKSLASEVCFDLWTGKSCCKLWSSCWKCKCSPLSQLSLYDLFEFEQMKVTKWKCQNRCCHIYTMLA